MRGRYAQKGLQTFSACPGCGDLKSGKGTGSKGLDMTQTLYTIIAYLDRLHLPYRSTTGMANDDALEEICRTCTYSGTTSETIAAN